MGKNRNHAIGVFDSGLGGLTVVKALKKMLPHEDVVYFGDTARVPYGTKSRESIIRFSKENADILLKRNVKMVVVACNSSSSLALATLKKRFKVPVIGVINPGAQKAVESTKNKKIGVIATPATVHSLAYGKRIKQLDRSIKVTSQACPLFVPLVEEGLFNGTIALAIAREYLNKLKASKIDTLILGCTHYPLLKSTLKKVMGSGVKLIDSAEEVASTVKDCLVQHNQIRLTKRKGRYEFLVSDEPKHFRKLAKRFLGFQVNNVKRCNGR